MRPWVIEVGCDDDRALVKSLSGNSTVTTHPWNPFEVSPVEVPADAIVHGSIGFLGRCPRETVWYSRDGFSWWACINHWGKQRMLNTGTPMSFKAFMTTNLDSEEFVHVRPVYEGKSFPGSVDTVKGHRRILRDKYSVPDSELILVSRPQQILEEFRVIVVKGKAITASSYRNLGLPVRLNADLRTDVMQTAETFAGVYSPSDVFALDLARTESGELRILEASVFNAAGFYACDLLKIQQALEP